MNYRGRKSGPARNQGRGGRRGGKHNFPSKPRLKDTIDEELSQLERRVQEFDATNTKEFKDFPLSENTIQGLVSCNYKAPTDIQRESIGLALQGNDILGAAKTGSGKTLAFIIPILELMYKEKWTQLDGLGALIISPTRELAFQTFGVLKKVGRFHDFSAGLVIGGKNLKEEAGRITQTNIVVCTPGRLLQHMDETSYFRADSLKVLVLDEADRILDMGFAQTMNAIIENLPTERQTMLFSATQTKSVKDLARLSLENPMYVSVHENALESTPSQLEQSYIVCELHEKLDMLWSFLRNHLKSKTLVFLTSCKQVKYIYEAFRRLRPGMTILALHGGMSQLKRVAVYNQYKYKQNVCLFATDIAARGLDFPEVNWVLQLDCPEDASSYIHRAGRTARYEKDGEALLVLLPSEEEHMVKQLTDRKIPIEKIHVNQTKLYKVQHKLEANCAADHTLKEFAQRAFVSYLRSIYLMKNKNVFNVHALDIEEYARSLGLGITPRVRFLQKEQKRIEESKKKTDTKLGKETPSTSALSQQIAKQFNADNNEDNDENDSSDESSDGSGTDSDESVENSSANKSTNKALTKLKSDKQKDKLSDKLKVTRNISNDSSESSEEDEESEEDSEEEPSDSEDSDDESVTKSKDKSEKIKFDVGDEDDDNLFKVKRNVDLESVLGPSEETKDGSKLSKKKQKILTKEDIAKKLVRKKIVVNTKVKFDETGQAEFDPLKQAKDGADLEEVGGINIELARKRMQEEDKIDKEIFRQRVRMKHREERLKRKEENRRKKAEGRYVDEDEEGDEADFEARLASDGEDDDDEGLPGADPLSFIPDPDKLYGQGSSSSGDDEEEDFDQPTPSKRAKFSQRLAPNSDESNDESGSDDDDDEEESGDDDDDDSDDDDDVMDTELSLKDDEELALRLLNS